MVFKGLQRIRGANWP